ncbi:hypothetical protein [Actinopolymorpha alba]|uniref:alpha/beta hydrolase n=1 Tax=Actinopolymorpha alba TaxID=533267 RepID=UPI001ED98CB1|nr:hypothetical protein [Actinopolymorpha alba]
MPAWATIGTRVDLRLPPATGPYGLGVVSLHLVDEGRQDPWWSEPHARELMVDVWYPARRLGHHRFAPWMPSPELARFVPKLEDFLKDSPDTPPGEEPIGRDVDLDCVRFPVTQALLNAPVDASEHRYPVVLFSPGFAADRQMGAALMADLASHGYVVVAIGHTYDANEIAFPDGRRGHGPNDGERSSNRCRHQPRWQLLPRRR